MKILVVGASRGIGLETVKSGLAAGHAIRAMARGEGGAPDHSQLERMQADAMKPDDVARALEGVDAVVQALGVKITLTSVTQPATLFSDATGILLPAMARANVQRLVSVTGFGAGDSRNAMSVLERMGHDAILGRIYADKTRQEAAIKASDLDWTIVRPGILTNGRCRATYRVLATPEEWRNGLISRADVAHFVLSALEEPATIRTAPVLIY